MNRLQRKTGNDVSRESSPTYFENRRKYKLIFHVCVEGLRPSQPNGVIVHILSPETDNCLLETAEGRE